jgi:hypothetical protein
MAVRQETNGRRGRLRHETAAVLAVGALFLAACGDDDDVSSTADEDTEVTTTAGTASGDGGQGVDEGAEAADIEVVAVDYRFGGLPGSVTAGTRFALRNESTSELHELVVLRLPDTEERSIEQLLALPEEELDFLADSEPAMVLIAPPGERGQAVVGDGTVLEPGRYAVICAIPVGADPAEYLEAAQTSDGPPDVAGGPPHFVEGMFAELVVE